MYRKQQPYQTTLFGQPILTKAAQRHLEDENSWQNSFYRNVTRSIDESIFSPLYSSGTGRPNADIRVMVAMRILKEGMGCSDSQLFEQARFNILFRRALGKYSLDDPIPSESSYYLFYSKIGEYLIEKKVNLFDKVFDAITKAQVLSYNLSGRVVRMDSKLLGSNIASYPRYKIVHCALVKSLSPLVGGLKGGSAIAAALKDTFPDALSAELASIILEDADSTLYRSSSADLRTRFVALGNTVGKVLDAAASKKLKGFELLSRVYREQYRLGADGRLEAIPSKEVSAKSVQNPNDADADFRNKHGQKCKGFVAATTQLCDDGDVSLSKGGKAVGMPKIVTHVEVGKASTQDTEFVKPGIEHTEAVTGQHVETGISDGGFYNPENNDYAERRGTKAVFTGFQGKNFRYDLHYDEGSGRLTVTDTQTGRDIPVEKTKGGKWRIETGDGETKSRRYFTKDNIKNATLRRLVETLPLKLRHLRNNIEADMFQLSFHTRNFKTRYRGLFKTKLFVQSRELWMNCVRLLNYDIKMAM